MNTTKTTLTRATTAADAARAIAFAMRVGGFEPGAPTTTTEKIDREVCEASACEGCGHEGMEFHPWTHKTRGDYLGFAVCPHCGATSEF
jgi:hypothetical protein